MAGPVLDTAHALRGRRFVAIGCDDHPRHVLTTLELRSTASPFDGIDMDSIWGLHYVHDNIAKGFQHYLEDLRRNSGSQLPYAGTYPYATFREHLDLCENSETQSVLQRRADDFLEVLRNPPSSEILTYLYNVKSTELRTEGDAAYFLESIARFVPTLKTREQELWIYVRFDDSYDENRERCEEVLGAEFENVVILPYCRELSEFGIWGNPEGYESLLMEFVRIAPHALDVQLHLTGGHLCRTTLASDSQLLRDLLSALASGRGNPGGSARLFQIPVDGGRSAFSFSSRDLEMVVTGPQAEVAPPLSQA